jgi:hypothetical protein
MRTSAMAKRVIFAAVFLLANLGISANDYVDMKFRDTQALTSARSLLRGKQYHEGMTALDGIIAQHQSSSGLDQATRTYCTYLKAMAEFQRGNYADALKLFKDTLKTSDTLENVAEKGMPLKMPVIITTYAAMGDTEIHLGNLGKSKEYYSKLSAVLEAEEARLNASSPLRREDALLRSFVRLKKPIIKWLAENPGKLSSECPEFPPASKNLQGSRGSAQQAATSQGNAGCGCGKAGTGVCGSCGSDQTTSATQPAAKPAESAGGGCGCGSAQPAANPAESAGGCGCGSPQPATQSAPPGGCGSCGATSATLTKPATVKPGSGAPQSAVKAGGNAGGCGCGSPATAKQAAGAATCGSGCGAGQPAASATQDGAKPAGSSSAAGCGCGTPEPAKKPTAEPAAKPGALASGGCGCSSPTPAPKPAAPAGMGG